MKGKFTQNESEAGFCPAFLFCVLEYNFLRKKTGKRREKNEVTMPKVLLRLRISTFM